MVETIRVSNGFYELLTAHQRSGETDEETLRRLVSGPDPAVLREEVFEQESEDANSVRRAIERRRESDR